MINLLPNGLPATRGGALRLRARFSEQAGLALVLVLGLLHGLVYVYLVPPWQHYEEPAHFEYAWMILTRRSIPGYGAYDNDIRRLIAASMIEHDFYRGLGTGPDLTVTDRPIDIGLGQADTAPLFHIIMTVPLGLFARADVDTRLYAARLTSLALFLVTLWVAYRLVSELTPAGHPLRWLVPAGMALLPALVDIMTAINDDVGAVAMFSVFLWACTRLLVRGFNWPRALAAIVMAGLCSLTKTTTLIALPLAPLALALAGLRRWRRRWAVIGALIGLALTLAGVGWGEAASWYPRGQPGAPARVRAPAAALGRYALALTDANTELWQPLLPADFAALRGRPVTLGAWIWASRPGIVQLPMLGDGQEWLSQAIAVGTEPAYHSFEATIPAQWTRAYVRLVAVPMGDTSGNSSVYYDGLTLLAGSWPTGAPHFNSTSGTTGDWAGRSFVNRLRNASGESGAVRVRPWAANLFQRVTGAYLSPGTLLAAASDWRLTGWVYAATARWLLTSFWARFGWAHIGLPFGWYLYAAGLTALGALGVLGGLRGVAAGPWGARRRAALWLAAAAALSWGTVFLRGLFTVLDASVLLPVARYAYPVIIPTMLVLVAGWYWLLGRPHGARAGWILAGLVVLDIVSVLSIYNYYSGG